MERRLLSMRTLLVATAAALAAGGVGVATGAIPDGNGVITACMLKNVGTVRLIDKSLPASSALGHCTSLEREVTWNQQGLAGTNGKDGLNGTDGKDGQDGVSITTAPEPASATEKTAAMARTGAAGLRGTSFSTASPALAPGFSSVLVEPCPVGDILLGGTFDQTESSTLTLTLLRPGPG